ncbi:hypothetical protein QFC21_006807 [Naganishia friedmannii]|uniref:Uncharacterized protein n=1 Tax=Naganishia friedmannii TaxID=89922 RepID=A0ACC2UZC3_9TREE|nr:hypothetical protein QFC21_006807 [Naganishia friedmannii]
MSRLPDPPGFAPVLALGAGNGASAAGIKGKNKKAIAAVGNGTQLQQREEQEEMVLRRGNDLKMKKAWEVALAPAKSLPMQAFMLYMSGSGIQIFSMGIVWMLLTAPWQACWNVLTTFEPFKQTTSTPSSASSFDITKPAAAKQSQSLLWAPMAAYIACQALVLGLGIYKCKQMGLVPTGTGDWLQFETRREPPEWSAVRLASYGQ